MTKKILTLILIGLLLLSACACNRKPAPEPAPVEPDTTDTTPAEPETPDETPEKVEPFLTADTYPVMDGSTANLPMMAEVMSEVCGISLDEAENLSSVSKTSQAWLNLANGDADILLVYEPAKATKEELDEIGTELEITPVGRDALVFINNEGNPVNDLSTQQLLDIYTGKTTNWKDVGGEDLEIVPFQRRETSGSQSMFVKLLMKDVTPMDAPTELRPAEMGELIDDLASYNNTKNALGFSVFYYVSEMYSQPGLKLMSCDGVTPSSETIASGEYPFVNDYFVAIRKDEPEDSPVRKLYNWILSDQGKAALKKAGYVPV